MISLKSSEALHLKSSNGRSSLISSVTPLCLLTSGIPASAGNSLDCLQDENPPHWLKSLQALTEMDGPAGSAMPTPQPLHTGLLDAHLPLHHRAAGGWAPYLPPPTANPASQFHSPPPGFQTAFRPPGQPTTELLQSAAVDRH